MWFKNNFKQCKHNSNRNVSVKCYKRTLITVEFSESLIVSIQKYPIFLALDFTMFTGRIPFNFIRKYKINALYHKQIWHEINAIPIEI